MPRGGLTGAVTDLLAHGERALGPLPRRRVGALAQVDRGQVVPRGGLVGRSPIC
jgi:hypothetical protein